MNNNVGKRGVTMKKEFWESFARKIVDLKEVTPFEMGVLAGMSVKYDFQTAANKTEADEMKSPA